MLGELLIELAILAGAAGMVCGGAFLGVGFTMPGNERRMRRRLAFGAR